MHLRLVPVVKQCPFRVIYVRLWLKVLPDRDAGTPEIQRKLIDSVHAEVGSRTIEELEAERDEILLGLLELRARRPETVSPRGRSDGVGVATRVR